MPKMVSIGANPDWRADSKSETAVKDRETMKAIKKAGPLRLPYISALENIRSSGGMYRILPESEPVKVKVDTDLNELSNQELKVMMLNLGVKTDKQMSKSAIISLIEKKLDEVTITDDE
jgi:hypothetical protein